MARGRNRNQKSKNGLDESDHTQTGEEEEISSPLPSPRTSPRRGIPEEKEGMNQIDLSKKLHKDARVYKEGHLKLPKAFIQVIFPKKTQTHRKPINMQWQL
jgi:hypothetical protein